jgi:CRISPR-associated protein Csy2
MRLTLIENLEIGDLNAEGNSLTSGASILPTGICGFGHWLQRQCQELGTVDSVAVAVHEFHRHEGMTKNPMALQGFSRDKIINPPIVQELKADARVSLILRHEQKEDVRQENVAASVQAKLKGASFCGGRCHSVREVHSYDEHSNYKPDGKPQDYSALSQRLQSWNRRGLPGSFLKDRADLIRLYNKENGQRDDLGAVFHYTTVFAERDADGKTHSYRRQHRAWIVPVAIGFQAIEPPSHTRAGRRDVAYPHAYAEPITGLGEFIGHTRALRENLLFDAEAGLFWRYRHQAATATFYISAL